MLSIRNPYIRDTITIDDAFNKHLATFEFGGPIYLLARIVEQKTDLTVGDNPLVFVVDEFRGNGHLINAITTASAIPGSNGAPAEPTQPTNSGAPGGSGGVGGAGGPGGTVTVMCRRSIGVRINVSGGPGAAGGGGGNGGPGSPATSTPGAPTTETHFDADGNPFEVEVPGEAIETPGTLGGLGGIGGSGGVGGDSGSIRFTSITDGTAPEFVATGGPGGPGGPGGLAGAHGAFAEIPADLDTSPVAGPQGAPGIDGTITVATVTEEEYVAGLRPLLDADGPFADDWAPYRLLVGQYFYRQFRRSDPEKGQWAATEFARVLELQPENAEALRWRSQLMHVPRPQAPSPDIEWGPGGLNALALPRDLDILPQFKAYSDAFTSFGILVLDFLDAGESVLLNVANQKPWEEFLDDQIERAKAARETTLENRNDAETDARLAGEAIASVQARLNQTTQDIQAALDEMKEEELDILGIAGTVFSVAAAVVAVVAAVPSFGASLVALAPSMVALSSAVIDSAEPAAKALLAGNEVDTAAVKKAYDKADKKAADVVKGAKAIVSFVEVVQKLNAATTRDNSKHMTLVRHGVELTHELLLARHRITLAEQRVGAAHARVARAEGAISRIAAVRASLAPTKEALRRTGLETIAIAESRADALLTLAFHAQRSLEIYLLTDAEDKVRLESGHLHPDRSRDYVEEQINEIELVRLLRKSWGGMLGPLDMQVQFSTFSAKFHERDERRLSFGADDPALETLRATRRFPFRIDAAKLPDFQKSAKALSVRLALVGATHPAGSEVTCEIRHGSAYETRPEQGPIRVDVLQPRVDTRDAKLARLSADEGLGPEPLITDPQSLTFWGRGIGGDYELSIPDHQFDSGLDLTGLTEVQVWIGYQFLR